MPHQKLPEPTISKSGPVASHSNSQLLPCLLHQLKHLQVLFTLAIISSP